MKPRIMRAASRPTTKAEPANFVGTVLSDPVFAPEQPSRLRASRVSFMPGGRTNWHKHAVGQVLYVLSGVGRYQLEGEPVLLREGRVLVASFHPELTGDTRVHERFLDLVREEANVRA